MRVNSAFTGVFYNRLVLSSGTTLVMLAIFFIASSCCASPNRAQSSGSFMSFLLCERQTGGEPKRNLYSSPLMLDGVVEPLNRDDLPRSELGRLYLDVELYGC